MSIRWITNFVTRLFDSKEFSIYISTLQPGYFRETIFCDGHVNPRNYSSFRSYQRGVNNYVNEHVDIDLEKELYKEATGTDIDDSECMILTKQLLRSREFEFHLKKSYNG